MAFAQFADFVIWLAFGFGFGLFSEVQGMVRPFFKSRFVADILLDLAFALVLLIAAAFLSMYVGGIQWYLLTGAAIGICIEKLTMHKLIAKGIETVYNVLMKVVVSCKTWIRGRKRRGKENGPKAES